MSHLFALFLASVFALAAVTKLAAPIRTAEEFEDLGLPRAVLLGRVVPIAELLVAATLTLLPRVGAIAAAVMLCGFTAVLINVLRTGRQVSCGCFGAVNRTPVTYATVIRNLWLLSTAAVAAVDPFAATDVPVAAVVMVTGSAVLLAAVVGQLLSLRRTLGRLWDVSPGGEQPADPRIGPDDQIVLDLEIDLDRQVEQLVPKGLPS